MILLLFVGRRSVYIWKFTSLEMCTKVGIEEWETTILHFGRVELLWGDGGLTGIRILVII